jgi:hypothetical protein
MAKGFNAAYSMLPANQMKCTTRGCDRLIFACLRLLIGAALLLLKCFRIDSLTGLGCHNLTC